jgi:uncharacterized protein (DUF2141 family)
VVVPASGNVTRNIGVSVLAFASVSGTLTIPSANANGKSVEIMLIPAQMDAASGGTAVTWTSGTTQAYTISNPSAGTYTVRAFIDMDDSKGPSVGDYVGYYGGTGVFPPSTSNVVVPASGTVSGVNITLSVYPAPDASVSGTITLPSGSPSGRHWIAIAGSSPGMSGVVAYSDNATWSGSGMTQSYTINDLVPGTYYIWFVIDMDGDDQPMTAGDLMGYYGGSGSNPPAAANVTVTAGQNRTGVNITAAGNP